MKKVITFVVMIMVLFTAANAAAEVTANWNTEVTGIEVTDMEKEFVNDGYDLAIVIVIENPYDEVKMDKCLIRWTDNEDDNYNDAYECLCDEYGLLIGNQEGLGHVSGTVAVCRMHNAASVVKQMTDHLNNDWPDQNFEMYVFENKLAE